MRKSWIGCVATTLLVVGLGFWALEQGAAGQENQDRETRIQQKRERLQVLVQRRQQEGANLQPVGELMRGLEPLIQQQKLAEAEALLDRALELANKLGSQEQSGPPPPLQRKMQRLQALAQKRMQEGGNLQPIGEVMGSLQPLIKQQKFSEAEALVDRALELLAEPAPPDKRSLIAYGARDTDGRQQIFVVRPDGTGKRRLTEDGNQNFFPAWSPDGKRLAFTSNRSGSPQIWVMDADGANARQLTSQGENVVPTWSPDGKRLAFESNRAGHFQIWVMDADGGNQKQVTTTATGLGDHAPAWSPDGRRIAFASPRTGNFAIWLMDPDGSRLTQLTTPRGDTYRHSSAPAWSPDGTKVAFWSGIGPKHGNIWVVDADVRNPRLLTDQPPGINCDEPVWSSDGKKILFASNRPGSQGIGIWIMEADGSNQRVLITDTHLKSRPTWEPVGGKHHATDDWREQSLQQWAAQGHSTALRTADLRLPPYIRRLTYFGERADWSHDGKRVLFLEKTFGDVFEIELATGVIRPITHHGWHY